MSEPTPKDAFRQLAEVTTERDEAVRDLASVDAEMQACYLRHGEVLRQLCETQAERDALKRRVEDLERERDDQHQASSRREAELQRALGEQSDLAEERLAWAHQLQADIEAEQQGRIALRQRFGAREDEAMAAFIERLWRAAQGG